MKGMGLGILVSLFLLIPIITGISVGWSGDVLTQYYCPKCHSENIEITLAEESMPKIERKSIDEIPDIDTNYGSTTLEVKWNKYIAKCKDCGYYKTFMRPY